MEHSRRKMIVISFVMMFIVVIAVLFYSMFVAGKNTITDATLVESGYPLERIYEGGSLYHL